jgi:hypothetical protein
MTPEEANRIVLLVESAASGPSVQARDVRRPELRARLDELRSQPEPAKGSDEQALLYRQIYERVYKTLTGETIPEDEYLAAKSVLSPERKGGPKKKHSETLLFACLGSVVAACQPKELMDADKHNLIADRVIDAYCEASGQTSPHAHYSGWVKAFLRAYADPE